MLHRCPLAWWWMSAIVWLCLNSLLFIHTNQAIQEILSLTCSLTSSIFSKMHFLISYCCHMLSDTTQYASMTTKCLPHFNYVTINPHIWTAVFLLMYHPLHEPETPVSTRWPKCCWKLVKLCKNCQSKGLLEILGLWFGRNILRRLKEQLSWRAETMEEMEARKIENRQVKLLH
jgi:hypothetical protein